MKKNALSTLVVVLCLFTACTKKGPSQNKTAVCTFLFNGDSAFVYSATVDTARISARERAVLVPELRALMWFKATEAWSY